MSPSHLFEPTYQALKQRLMSGTWDAGARLEAARIAAELGVSVSPVRDCLNRLAGERMIEAHAGEGFQVPRFDVQSLRNILDVNQMLLMMALQRSKPAPLPPSDPENHALRAARLFRHLAAHSRNLELETLIDNVSARLNRLRLLDTLVLPDGDQDLDGIEGRLIDDDWSGLQPTQRGGTGKESSSRAEPERGQGAIKESRAPDGEAGEVEKGAVNGGTGQGERAEGAKPAFGETEGTKPEETAEASDPDNAGIRREPELGEHEEVVPSKALGNEFAIDDEPKAAKAAARRRQLGRVMRGNARNISLDPGDGMEL